MIFAKIYLYFSLLIVPTDSPRLAEIKPAPAFALIDQNKIPVRFDEIKEDVLLVSFIFTTCSGSCPATTHRMAKVSEDLGRRGLLKKGNVRLISISLDPKRDRPDVLRRYMGLYEIDGAHWSFLTGPPKQVNKVVSDWGMWAKPAANGQLNHPSRIFLVDRKRNIREIYNLGFMRSEWVVEDIQSLLNDR